jgi:hypothetical protein
MVSVVLFPRGVFGELIARLDRLRRQLRTRHA